MTGEEKLHALLLLIHKEYKKLLTGDMIELESSILEKTGIELKEQSTALEILKNNYRCIEYKAVPVFANESELSPYDIRDIAEISMLNGLSQEYIKQSFLDLTTYKITVFDNIESIVNSLDRGAEIVNSRNKSIAKITFNKNSKTIRLTFDGLTRDIKQIGDNSVNGLTLIKNLLLYPNEPRTRQELGLDRSLTVLKDWPKTLGFSGKLKNIFFDIDSKNKTITFYPEKLLTPDEAEIVKAFVNNN